jgi:hypothetical protein
MASKPRESIYGAKHMTDIGVVHTVADLKALLEQLPDALPLTVDGEGYKPVWFNVGSDDENLSLEPNDGTFDRDAQEGPSQ